MTNLTVNTYWVKIYISGPIEAAKQIVRQECLKGGLCVTIEPTMYIYNGGEESGYVIGMLNYPKFPNTSEELIERAKVLARAVLAGTYQHSYLIMTPETTEWYSNR